MQTKDFWFELPPELIAQYPSPQRGDSRLMVVEPATGGLLDSHVADLPQLLSPGSLLVLNDSRVRPLRLIARRLPSRARQELLLIEPAGEGCWRCMIGRLKRQRVGQLFELPDGLQARFVGRSGTVALLQFSGIVDEAYLQRWGEIPLPPYIRRPPSAIDRERYQTLYARHDGSAAAPTAGLHFTDELFGRLRARAIEIEFITLHVGPATFEPVRGDDPRQHRMHGEQFWIDPAAADHIEAARREGRPIVAVGTTTVRALETAWRPDSQSLRRGLQSSDLFIYPPYQFRVVDRMFTNFHTPGSTLLMMVCAFGGTELMLQAYRRAVELRYRFFSYGDAMLVRQGVDGKGQV